MVLVEALYALCVVLLSVYGVNSLVLVWLYLRHRRDTEPQPLGPLQTWPRVTVQLPVYNEIHTIERLLTAVAGLDYPSNLFEIQVLDDSTDQTRPTAANRVARLRRQGVDISHIVRATREGYKAGALAEGLRRATGEYIAMFDADFAPHPDFLRRVLPPFADPRVGCVQARWGHLNRDYSRLTRVQALGVDGHFVVEQTARSRSGLFVNFNGSAGVWRRSCIEDSGGWHGDTLTEDLDLSYRAQLRGWRIAYQPDVVVPAELPAQITGFKRQQARWAQGSIQTALKLLAPLLRSRQPWQVKLEGCIHLTGYAVHPLMLLLLLLTAPMSFSSSWLLTAAPLLMVAAIGPPLMYVTAKLADGPHWRERLRPLPVLMLLGMGLALSNTWAVLKAILGVRQVFERTPKFALHGDEGAWVNSRYALGSDWLVGGELMLAALALALLAAPRVTWGFAPWLLMYAGGFGYVAGLSLTQASSLRRWLATQPKQVASKAGRIGPVERSRTPAGSPGQDT